MSYEGFTTFSAEQADGILRVTFDFPPVNVQGQEMLADLNSLALRLERDRTVKVVIFQSAHPEIWVCHYDTNLLNQTGQYHWPSYRSASVPSQQTVLVRST